MEKPIENRWHKDVKPLRDGEVRASRRHKRYRPVDQYRERSLVLEMDVSQQGKIRTPPRPKVSWGKLFFEEKKRHVVSDKSSLFYPWIHPLSAKKDLWTFNLTQFAYNGDFSTFLPSSNVLKLVNG
jgi:hypothetical protein